MMKHRLPAVLMVAAMSLWGCSGMVTSVSEYLRNDLWWQAAQSDSIRMRARELEARGDLAMALDHWRLLARIDRENEDAVDEIARIRDDIADRVRSHFQRGMAEQANGRHENARNHFLAALRLDPRFQPALKQLKVHYWPFPLTVHLSKPGDRPDSVAKTVFGDENKGSLVAWFNDLPMDETIKPGTLLLLPRMQSPIAAEPADRQQQPRTLPMAAPADSEDPDPMPKAPARIPMEPVFDATMADARRFFEHGLYRQSLDRIATVIALRPDHPAARELAGEARFRLAREHAANKRYLIARHVLENADPNHQPSMELKAHVDKRLEALAQIHYRNGVKRFINEDLQAAIDEWEMALVCNPDHLKARENMENARRLLDKIQRIP
jgi:tetratricopeptide (TPR) repeat protein